MPEKRYDLPPDNDEKTAKEDYHKVAGSGGQTLSDNSSHNPHSIPFGQILAWILPRLVMAVIVLYAVIKIFNLLFPL